MSIRRQHCTERADINGQLHFKKESVAFQGGLLNCLYLDALFDRTLVMLMDLDS